MFYIKKNVFFILYIFMIALVSCKSNQETTPDISNLLAGKWYVAEGTQAIETYLDGTVTETVDVYSLMEICEKDNPWEFSSEGYFGFYLEGLACEGETSLDNNFLYEQTWQLDDSQSTIYLRSIGELLSVAYEVQELTESRLVLYSETLEDDFKTKLTLVFERN